MTRPSSNPESSSGGSDAAASSTERVEFELDSETLNPNRFARRRTDRHGWRPDRAGGGADRAGSARTGAQHRRPCLGTKRVPAKTREVARGTHLVPRPMRGGAGGGGGGGGRRALGPRDRDEHSDRRGTGSGSPRGAYWQARSPSPAAGEGAGGKGGGAKRPCDLLFKKDRANFRDFLRYFPRFFA